MKLNWQAFKDTITKPINITIVPAKTEDDEDKKITVTPIGIFISIAITVTLAVTIAVSINISSNDPVPSGPVETYPIVSVEPTETPAAEPTVQPSLEPSTSPDPTEEITPEVTPEPEPTATVEITPHPNPLDLGYAIGAIESSGMIDRSYIQEMRELISQENYDLVYANNNEAHLVVYLKNNTVVHSVFSWVDKTYWKLEIVSIDS